MSFDPVQFMDMQITEANSTIFVPIPVGAWQAVVSKVETRTWTKKDDATKSGLALDVTWEILSPEVLAELERDKVTVKQNIMLDLTEAGMLDMGKGKNVALGRLREAVGLNKPGEPFAFSMLTGRMAVIQIIHEPYNDTIQSRIKAVAAVS